MSEPGTRTICHVDMDAFFVSVELRRRPELRGKPVVVGGTGRRGVVAAASYEARRYGVFSAMPSAVAARRCPNAVFLPGDMALYQSVGEEVRAIFARFTPLVEPLSVDEAFLDVTGSRRLFGSGVEIGHQIRAAVRSELELSCSVGVAPNKFLAKLASVEAKPQVVQSPRGSVTVEPGLGVVEVVAGSEQEFLRPLPVQRLWGVGPKTQQRLEALGIRSVADLADFGEDQLRRSLGDATGRHLYALAFGRDDRPVVVGHDAKSISHEQTYHDNKHTHDELHVELVRQADAVAARLRAANLGARTLSIKVRFDDGFRTITRSVTKPGGLDNAIDIVAALEPVLANIDPSPGVRLFGVAASGLGPVEQQLSLDALFNADPGQNASVPDWNGATAAVDSVRERFGDAVIGPASAMEGRRIKLVRRGQQQWGPDHKPGNESNSR